MDEKAMTHKEALALRELVASSGRLRVGKLRRFTIYGGHGWGVECFNGQGRRFCFWSEENWADWLEWHPAE